MNDKNIIVGAAVLIVAVGAILFATSDNSVAPTPATVATTPGTTEPTTATGPNVPLAQCLKAKGVTFFGAFWCPHCQAQKKLFGDAVPALPYVECSTPDQSGQTQVCIDKKVESYPTWEFADGSRVTGEQTFEVLAQKSGCEAALPGATSASTPAPLGTSSPK